MSEKEQPSQIDFNNAVISAVQELMNSIEIINQRIARLEHDSCENCKGGCKNG